MGCANDLQNLFPRISQCIIDMHWCLCVYLKSTKTGSVLRELVYVIASPREITYLTRAINSQIALQTMLLHIQTIVKVCKYICLRAFHNGLGLAWVHYIIAWGYFHIALHNCLGLFAYCLRAYHNYLGQIALKVCMINMWSHGIECDLGVIAWAMSWVIAWVSLWVFQGHCLPSGSRSCILPASFSSALAY